MLGYTREEIQTRGVADIHPAEVMPYVLKTFDAQASGKIVLAPDMLLQRKDSSTLYADISASPVKIAGARYLLSIIRDVTERHHAEEEIRQSEERFRGIFDSVDDGIALVDMDGHIVEANRRVLEMLGLNPETDLKGEDAFNYVSSLYLKKAGQDMQQAMRDGGFDITRYDLKRVNGTEFPAEISSRILRDGTGAPVGFVGIMRDITERQRIEQERHRNVENLVGAMKATIGAVAMTMEKRDPYTAGHQRRVAHLAIAIARAIGLAEERVEGLRMTALVHDIGKIMVPTEILSKPTMLSNAEYELIKTHPQIAYDILKEIEFPWPLAQTVLQHHERDWMARDTPPV